MNKAIIFDVQKFSLNDGPGIRTTIFFKGCNLQCAWCHNPESIDPNIEVKFDKKKCNLCKECLGVEGIDIVDNSLKLNFSKIKYNYKLTELCPNNAFSTYGYYVTCEELIEEIIKDRKFYTNGGGVTLSGGEALLQLNFVYNLLNRLKILAINTCLDLNGANSLSSIQKTFGLVDFYLLDFKLTSEFQKYIKHNTNFYNIFNELVVNNQQIILRCPIIKGVNDNDAHFNAIANLTKNKNVIKCDILPYHNLKKSFVFNNTIENNFDIFTNEELQIIANRMKKLGATKLYLHSQKI